MTTTQAPIDSPFGYRSTALEVVAGLDLSGKTAFVTGGYSGLGTEIVRALTAAGARVLVGARRPDKAAEDLADVPDHGETEQPSQADWAAAIKASNRQHPDHDTEVWPQ